LTSAAAREYCRAVRLLLLSPLGISSNCKGGRKGGRGEETGGRKERQEEGRGKERERETERERGRDR
jgi:hypothetical protein